MPVLQALQEIPDHRKRQGREYPLHALLGLCVVAILAGHKGVRGMARYDRLSRGFRASGLLGAQTLPTGPHPPEADAAGTESVQPGLSQAKGAG
ncbi:MAG: transposase family protein [Deinococcota bacterium]